MTFHVFSLLAQIDPTKVSPDAKLVTEASAMPTWLIAGVLTVAILAITFKTSKRSHLEKE